MSDSVQRFHFIDSPVRGEIVQLHNVVADALSRHNYPPRVAQLLSEALAAAVLLTNVLKFEGKLTMQAQGEGPLSYLMVECTHLAEVRGIAHIADSWQDSDNLAELADLFPKGQLAITIEPEHGQRYQGIVPLLEKNLAACIEFYFAQSEQLPTRLWLATDGQEAAGIMLQAMPKTEAADDSDAWDRACHLTETITPSELLELPANEVLYRLYHEENVELLNHDDVCFKCSCSRERTETALLSLGHNDIVSLIEEQKRIAITCQFCYAEYTFDRIDVEQILRGGNLSTPEQLQ